MKTKAFTLLLAATVGIGACQSGRQTPPPTSPPGPTGPATAQPPPNPNPEPPVPPVATPVAGAPARPVAPAAAGAAPPPAAAVPDQPAVALAQAPVAPVKPHREILELKRAGQSDEFILNKVRSDNVNYHLTTADVRELRDAGIPESILEAMLRSGQPQPSAGR